MFGRQNPRIWFQTGTKIASLATVGALTLGSAHAVPVTTPLTGGWSMTYDSDQVSSVAFTATPVAGQDRGTLSYTKTFHSLSPIIISFADSDTLDTEFGLRLTLNETVANMSGSAWDGFTLALGGPVYTTPAGVSSAHPGFAHFHDDGATFGPFSSLAPFNATNMILLDSGTLANGASASFTGIGVHQWESVGENRDFPLTEMPHAVIVGVPEPGSLLLFGGSLIGLGLGLGLLARSKRKVA